MLKLLKKIRLARAAFTVFPADSAGLAGVLCRAEA